MNNIYSDIAKRTGGNIYIGVVGPVRTGKSTLIKRFMEQLVIPCIEDPFLKERAQDELPQSGSGKTIMTSEPKFVPEEAVEISPDGTTKLRIRMIDSVGYMVDGAVGAEENGIPRMVATPWCDNDIPMTEAAEIGTKKVMEEHCSIGLVVTTDGTVTDIPRSDYLDAERRAIQDMQKTGKPFIVIVNSRYPYDDAACNTAEHIRQNYGVNAIIADCQALESSDISAFLQKLLLAFPMQQLRIHLPRWLDVLENDHPVKQILYSSLLSNAESIETLGQAEQCLASLQNLPEVQDFSVRYIDPSTGNITCTVTLPENLFYEILTHKTGIAIQSQAELLSILIKLSKSQKEYDKVADALASVKATGYGIVMPTAEEMTLQTPEVVKKGGAFGVKLQAGAPSIHMIRVDIDTQISPMVGGEQQSQDLITYLTGEEPNKLWQSNIFGRSVYDLIQDGLTSKLIGTPEEVRTKFRNTLTRIVNEGANGLICLII